MSESELRDYVIDGLLRLVGIAGGCYIFAWMMKHFG